MTRPILAYLVTVTVGTGIVYAVKGAKVEILGFVPLALAAVLALIPALVLTVELVHRFEAASRGARAVVGAASWAGWGLCIAIALAVLSRVVLVAETLAGGLVVLAASGAGFSFLAFDGYETRAGRALTVSALVVAAFVIAGSIAMSGRWGAAA
ncbi:MAG: hypothetical protein AABZ33_14575 [Chloroflexota bacterium]